MRIDELQMKHRLPNTSKEASDILIDAGWHEVGAGHYAEVYSKPDINYVVKVFERDSAYLAYLDLIWTHSNPHFPKTKGKFWISRDANTRFNAIRLEKLEPCFQVDVDGYRKGLSGMLSAYLIAKRHILNDIQIENMRFAEIYLADKPELVAALDLINDNLLTRYHLDLNGANIMMRADGTPVIIDPIYE